MYWYNKEVEINHYYSPCILQTICSVVDPCMCHAKCMYRAKCMYYTDVSFHVPRIILPSVLCIIHVVLFIHKFMCKFMHGRGMYGQVLL